MEYAAVEYSYDSFHLKIFPAGKKKFVNWDEASATIINGCLKFFPLKPEHANEPLLVSYEDAGEYNIEPLHLKETVRYKCEITSNLQATFNLDFKNGYNKFLKREKDDENGLTFQFINYLGRTSLSFGQNYELPFEIVPNKISYKEDYVNLTNAIAEECSALLLDYSSPTTHSFSHNFNERHNTALEQFIFLRQFCYVENLEGLFGSIKRNPDRKLVSENELKPFGTGVISQSFFTNPFSYAKEWNDLGDDLYLPSKIATIHKYDVFDTPANRFLKFALNEFLEVCECIKQHVDPKSVYFGEAMSLKDRLEEILQDPLFDDVMDMTIMPSSNQVLEKREGYAQIYNAFFMMDLALKLDWKGKEDVYSGEAKNTALLYEYWLFFELRKIIKSIEGCRLIDVDDDTKSFVTDNDGLTIVLQQGVKSVEHFEVNDLKVNLYYNYTFYPKDFEQTKYEGSYSRPFRPDYTIAIFPNYFQNEHDAIEAAEVRYIHFDAKYRLDTLTQFINKEIVNRDIDGEINKEINDEKNDSVTNTYKRGDLLKMHTYNDAIRRTVGSYVLYPGTTNITGKKRFSVYEEILPGVGAFALRPGDENTGENTLKTFIQEVITFCENPASRIARTGYFEKMISESPSEGQNPVPSSNTDAELFMLGFLRNDYHDWLIENHLIPLSADDNQYVSSERGIYFYYHAIRDGSVYPLHRNISKAKYFCARCRNDFGRSTDVTMFGVDPWMAEIESTELISAENLAIRLREMNNGDGFVSRSAHSAEYYYLVHLKNIQPASFSQDSFLPADSGNLAISAYSPKIVKRVR